MRAVLDPNVIISGILSTNGAPARLLKAWREGVFEVVVSEQLLAELARALAYPKLRKLISETDAKALVGWVEAAAVLAGDIEPHPTIRSQDPGDDYLVALAAANRAALVSGDRHLLDLSDRIPVYKPAEFLKLVGVQD